jgi:hypothetical protein
MRTMRGSGERSSACSRSTTLLVLHVADFIVEDHRGLLPLNLLDVLGRRDRLQDHARASRPRPPPVPVAVPRGLARELRVEPVHTHLDLVELRPGLADHVARVPFEMRLPRDERDAAVGLARPLCAAEQHLELARVHRFGLHPRKRCPQHAVRTRCRSPPSLVAQRVRARDERALCVEHAHRVVLVGVELHGRQARAVVVVRDRRVVRDRLHRTATTREPSSCAPRRSACRRSAPTRRRRVRARRRACPRRAACRRAREQRRDASPARSASRSRCDPRDLLDRRCTVSHDSPCLAWPTR